MTPTESPITNSGEGHLNQVLRTAGTGMAAGCAGVALGAMAFSAGDAVGYIIFPIAFIGAPAGTAIVGAVAGRYLRLRNPWLTSIYATAIAACAVKTTDAVDRTFEVPLLLLVVVATITAACYSAIGASFECLAAARKDSNVVFIIALVLLCAVSLLPRLPRVHHSAEGQQHVTNLPDPQHDKPVDTTSTSTWPHSGSVRPGVTSGNSTSTAPTLLV